MTAFLDWAAALVVHADAPLWLLPLPYDSSFAPLVGRFPRAIGEHGHQSQSRKACRYAVNVQLPLEAHAPRRLGFLQAPSLAREAMDETQDSLAGASV